MSDHATSPHATPDAAHDDREINVRVIAGIAVGFVVVAVVVHLAMLGLFKSFEAREAQRSVRQFPLASTGIQFPREPRIQPHPSADLDALRRQEDAVLSTYGWVDEKAGVARIPIDRAMQLLVERGLPARAMEAKPR